MEKPITRNVKDDILPTAASASSPSPFPTIAVSAMEYICCSILVKSIGKKNVKISFVGFPLVKS